MTRENTIIKYTPDTRKKNKNIQKNQQKTIDRFATKNSILLLLSKKKET